MAPRLTSTPTVLNDLVSSIVGEKIERILPNDPAKRIVAYGAGSRGAIINAALKSLGRQLAYFIDSDPAKQDTMVCGVPVYSPVRVKDENLHAVFVIVAADDPTGIMTTLESYGLIRGIHAVAAFGRSSINEGTPYTAPLPLLDFALGYNRASDIPGFKCLSSSIGTSGGEPLRIVVLGNSTTHPDVADPLIWDDVNSRADGCGSWPRYLHEILNSNGIDNVIFNGAMSAYTSAQEVIKLIRDGLTLSPDVVISLDGINDIGQTYWHENKYPKMHSYFKKVDNQIKPLLKSKSIQIPSIESTASIEGICYGIESQNSPAEEWYTNQCIMKSICTEFGIEFISFLQPGGLYLNSYFQSCCVNIRIHWLISYLFISFSHLTNSYGRDNPEKILVNLELREILQYYLSCAFGYNATSNNFEGKHDDIEKFYHEARMIADRTNYIVDIVDILNGYPDAFYDGCHCTAKGNKLIAERIYMEITANGVLGVVLHGATGRSLSEAARSVEFLS